MMRNIFLISWGSFWVLIGLYLLIRILYYRRKTKNIVKKCELEHEKFIEEQSHIIVMNKLQGKMTEFKYKINGSTIYPLFRDHGHYIEMLNKVTNTLWDKGYKVVNEDEYISSTLIFFI